MSAENPAAVAAVKKYPDNHEMNIWRYWLWSDNMTPSEHIHPERITKIGGWSLGIVLLGLGYLVAKWIYIPSLIWLTFHWTFVQSLNNTKLTRYFKDLDNPKLAERARKAT